MMSSLARRGLARAYVIAALAMASLQPISASADTWPAAAKAAGFSAERLRRLDEVMQRAIDEHEYAGIVTLLARHGKVIHLGRFGKQDLASSAPLAQDTIFRINSMTKPVVAAAMMILYEEGRWTPQDPLVKFIPQFAGLKVYQGTDASGHMLTESPVHPPTLRELMTHTAGFSYDGDPSPVGQSYRDAQGRSIFFSGSLQAMIDRLATAPLLYQPSSRWVYGVSNDIQGYLIEKMSGMTLPQFLKQRLFTPLGMKDTGFYVPQEKRSRFATLYMRTDRGELVPTDFASYGLNYDAEPSLPRGGAGLVSTAMDYFRFAQMLLNGGALDGVRILGPQTVKLMLSNHLPDALMREFRGGGVEFDKPKPGLGYGYDGAVVTDPALADVPLGRGSYFWGGGAGTWFWIDPQNDIVFVGLVQQVGWTARDGTPGVPPNLAHLSIAATYQALLSTN
jgi:CubicO group peptidase (beta-lactamase class C family)